MSPSLTTGLDLTHGPLFGTKLAALVAAPPNGASTVPIKLHAITAMSSLIERAQDADFMLLSPHVNLAKKSTLLKVGRSVKFSCGPVRDGTPRSRQKLLRDISTQFPRAW